MNHPFRIRRYRFESGAILAVHQNRICYAIPAWCHHIGIPVDREQAVIALRHARGLRQKITILAPFN